MRFASHASQRPLTSRRTLWARWLLRRARHRLVDLCRSEPSHGAAPGTPPLALPSAGAEEAPPVTATRSGWAWRACDRPHTGAPLRRQEGSAGGVEVSTGDAPREDAAECRAHRRAMASPADNVRAGCRTRQGQARPDRMAHRHARDAPGLREHASTLGAHILGRVREHMVLTCLSSQTHDAVTSHAHAADSSGRDTVLSRVAHIIHTAHLDRLMLCQSLLPGSV